ncbi:MAG: amino acid adenylation domain-containing protein, partial [Burkholderiaceae bacterium]
MKIRGFRIELGEIEAQLVCHPLIKEAVVLAREDNPGDKRLVAYLTLVPNEAIGVVTESNIDELRSHLKSVLPEYMVPSAFVRLEALPLTPNGKLDRKALPAPNMSALPTRLYEAPQGEVEETLANIWQDILHIERVSRHDNFFDLGGHSLLLVPMIERLRQVGLSSDVRSIFQAHTLTDLATGLSRGIAHEFVAPPNLILAGSEVIIPDMLPLIELDQAQIDSIVATVPGGAANVQDIYPLISQQEGFLFHYMLSGDEDPNVLPILLAFETRTKLNEFLSALQIVIERHDLLRTAVLWKNQVKPVQVVYRRAELPIQVIELEPMSDPIKQLNRRMEHQRLQRINIQQAPLIHVEIAGNPHTQEWYALVRMHQIIDEITSMQIVISEIVAHLSGEADRLLKPVAYREFVAQILANTKNNDAKEFFRSRLSDIDEPTILFGLADVYGNGSKIEITHQIVNTVLAQRLRTITRHIGVSVAAFFHVAWALVVAHFSGRNDVVFGSVFSGRLQGLAGADRVVGFLVNTLPLRMKLKDLNVYQIVQDTNRELIALLPYEQTSLALAQRCSAVPASTPLFNAVLNYRHNNVVLDGIDIAEGIKIINEQERTNYPFWLDVDDTGEGFNLIARTEHRGYPCQITAYMNTVIDALVRALETTPEHAVLDLPILPESERRQVLEEFNATAAEYPKDKLIHELFEEQVKQSPGTVAVVFEDEQLTYAELNSRANQLAHYLVGQGIQPDTLVAICAERSLEMVVGLLGILKAGGAYVPLDPNYPQERLSFMLGDANPKILLTQARLKASLPATYAQVITLDSDWSEIAGQAETDLAAQLLGLVPRHLAYVIYTSGSTGQPKGAMNEHCAIVNRLQWMQEAYRLNQHDRVLQKTPFSFDVSVWEFFWPLLFGARLVMARPQGHQDAAYLSQLIQDTGITTLHFVPSMLQAFLAQPQLERCENLRHIVCSGEELPLALQNQCLEYLPHAKLHNLYGPTEAAIDVTYWECRIDASLHRVPIGRPIANTQIYILDNHGQVVPRGVAGEIYIGGVGVARGYLNRPALTAERFVADPFNTNPEARLYKTGDLGRWRPDGNIEYLGRNDHQVKIRGFRIELGEIEAQLVCHPLIKEAVVLAREDNPGDKRLVAYLTLVATKDTSASPELNSDELKTYLKLVLPEYVVPSAFVMLEAMPLTPNGKLDRNALPAPDQSALQTQAYEAPQGEIEEVLAGIWQDTLHVERVSRYDNFFELGGHSLLAVQTVARIRHTIGRNIALRDLFEHPVLAEIAKRLPVAEASAQTSIEYADRSQPVPLSFAQQRLWFLDQFESAGSAYHIPGTLRLQGPLDQHALQLTLDTLIVRHEILRTSFVSNDGSPVQVIAEEAYFALTVIDLSALPSEE